MDLTTIEELEARIVPSMAAPVDPDGFGGEGGQVGGSYTDEVSGGCMPSGLKPGE